MNFSAISSRTLLGKIMRLPLRLIPKHQVVLILQGPLRGFRWVARASNHGYWLGSYEFEKQLTFTRHIKPGHVVYDIGAHVGFYTLLSAKLVGREGKVYAFEPLPDNLTFLNQHVAMNHLANVTVVNKAVSNSKGERKFNVASSRAMGKLLSPDGPLDSAIYVDTISLDDFIFRLNNPLPDVIKIDIEGEEFKLLQGSVQLLKTHSVTLFLATHGSEVRSECIKFLKSFGYVVEIIDQGVGSLQDELVAFKLSLHDDN